MDSRYYTFIASGYGTNEEKTLRVYNMDKYTNKVYECSSAKLTNPSYAAYNCCNIFTLSEIYEDSQEYDGFSPLYLYKLAQCKLPLYSEAFIESEGIVYLDYSPKYKTLFGACYGSGDVFSIGVDGSEYTELKSLYRLPPAEDGISRAHCAQLDQCSRFLYATNFYTNKVYCFYVKDGYLIPNYKYPYITLDDNTGPRHIIFHQTKPIAYITCETSNQVIVVEQNRCTGELTVIQVVDTLPPDYTEVSYVSTGFVTANGEYFLVANRGANNIVTYKIGCDGRLKYSSTAPCYGNWPRHIASSKDGKYIFICNQLSNELVIAPLTQYGEVLTPNNVIEFNGCAFALDI